ncbi:MAG TPA: M23 family metallopeptidase, partial [bacterium]|nr:M23 family metallopeptidase [bacterium]
RDEIAAIAAEMDLSAEKCTEMPPRGDDYLLVTYRVGKEEKFCYPADVELVAALDAFLLLPDHTMLWPFKPQNEAHPVGHTAISFQDYSPLAGDEYFHPGTDIVMPENAKVYNILPGRVVKYDYYSLSGGTEENRMYFEVVIETQNGLTLQYHHIDPDSVSAAVKAAKQSGEVLPAGAEIGHIVSWTVVETGYSNELFHHLHLNVFTRDLLPLNGLQLLIPHPDTIPPVIETVTLLNESLTTVLDPAALSAGQKFHVIVESYDLMDDNIWPLPPRSYGLSFDCVDAHGVAEVLQGGSYDYLAALSSVKEDFVCDYYLCDDAGMNTKGDYGARKFFVNITAFDRAGAVGEPLFFDKRTCDMTVGACDEYDNCATTIIPLVVQ